MQLFEMQGLLAGKCLPGDMFVGESLAQYLLRQLNQRDELVRQVSALQTSQDNIINGLGIKGDGPRSLLVLEKFIALQAERDALAAENVALNNFIATSCYVQAGEEPAWQPAIDHAPESPATNCLSVDESRFLTDVITAAGLLSHGKQDKGLARRITDFCVARIGSSNPANLRAGRKG